jgi:G3E family GTPase
VDRTRLVVIAGQPREAAGQVATRLLGPDTAVVHHDLRRVSDGILRRRLRTAGSDVTAVLEMAHGCVSCALREDVLPLLERLDGQVGTVVLHLDPMVEPEPVCQVVDVDLVVTVVHEPSWLADCTGDEPVPHSPEHDDRTLAQVTVGQTECADLLVLAGVAEPWTAARTAAALDRLTPGITRLRLTDVDRGSLMGPRRGGLIDIHGQLLRGQPPLDSDCGVAVTLFRERRPFHPERLHEAIDVLLEGVIRARGRVWVATQPDVALWLESAGGGLRIGDAGTWLAALDDASWDRAPAERRAKAALDWHPRYGDRVQEIAVLTHDADPEHLHAVLSRALLTDTELTTDWSTLADPFAIAASAKDEK